jgi:hypothetical protein
MLHRFVQTQRTNIVGQCIEPEVNDLRWIAGHGYTAASGTSHASRNRQIEERRVEPP